MGSGVARALRAKYPVVYTEYSKIVLQRTADSGYSYLGQVIPAYINDELLVLNLVCQQFYGQPDQSAPIRYTSYDALDVAFTEVAGLARALPGELPVHYPLIGSGLGGAQWCIVKEIIDYRLKGLEHYLWIPVQGRP
jgi:glutathione peroxidase-family protein